MAIVRTPADPYPKSDWLNKPREAEDGDGYAKYMYKNGESLATIAQSLSNGAEAIAWHDLTQFNWGTSKPSEINYYLREHTGCKYEDAPKHNYRFSEEDANPFIWVPKPEQKVKPGKYRSPGRQDVGHVALDDPSDPKHINTLVIKPVYSVSLALGDVDALFDADKNGNMTREGRMQRLQVLGYLYTPLGHSKVGDHFKKCWEYYRGVHTSPPRKPPTDAELDAILKQEVQNNIVASGFPKRGEILEKGRLPGKGEAAAIRFPGGYCFTYPRVGDKPKIDANWRHPPVNDADKKYDFGLTNCDRHEVEDALWDDNDLMGKIPLVATVHRIRPDGEKEPAEGVSVYFQLIMPDEVKTPFKAPDLRNKELDFSQAYDASDPTKCETSNRGPKAFVKKVFKDNKSANDKDPQKDNCPAKFGGRRDRPVEGEGKPGSDDYKPGVFEVRVKRKGLHSKRSPKHIDYGKMIPAYAVEPVVEQDDEGNEVRQHEFAVCAKTNKKGNAGVIFMPSRCGGDRYKLRAYVGPETLAFAGDKEDGPVMDTGTMVVWRNIRVSRYLQFPVPAKAGASNDIKTLFQQNTQNSINTFDKAWNRGQFASGIEKVDFSPEGTAGPVRPPNPAKRSDGTTDNSHYRPAKIQFIGPALQYRQCYCELINDRMAWPETIGADEMKKAIDHACDAAADSGEVNQAVLWHQLMFDDPTSPFMLNIRDPNHYNNIIDGLPNPKPPKLAAAHVTQIRKAFSGHVKYALMEYFSGGGVLPGLTLVQAARGDTWDVMGWRHIFTSGVALSSRGAFLFYTDDIYNDGFFPYDTTANAIHEWGHVLVRQHQPPVPNNGDVDTHQPQYGLKSAPGAGDCLCVMSYRACYGQFCGRCALALRGWKTKSGTNADGA